MFEEHNMEGKKNENQIHLPVYVSNKEMHAQYKGKKLKTNHISI